MTSLTPITPAPAYPVRAVSSARDLRPLAGLVLAGGHFFMAA